MLGARSGSVSDEVTVVNLSEVPLTLNLYAVDALNASDGELALEPSYEEPMGLASWVSFDTPSGQGFVRVGPRGRVPVPFTVTVPDDATVGDHVAGIVVSSVADGQTPGDRGTAIELEQRVAIRLSMRVAGTLIPELSIENLTARYVGTPNPFGRGSAVVTYTLRNTGNVRLGGVQTVTVEGLVGSGATRVDGPDVPVLLPGGSVDYEITVEDVAPLLLMNAQVDVQPLPAEGDADQQAPTATESTSFWAVPWFLITIVLTIALLAAWWRRRRRAAAAPLQPTGRRPATSGSRA
jgi:hypothetical protein